MSPRIGAPRGEGAAPANIGASGAPSAATSRRALLAVREVWTQRREARSRGDVLYLLYVALLSLLVIGIPVLRAVGDGLARPDVLPVLSAGRAPQASTAVVLVGAAGLVLLGAVRGPALLSPFFTATLADSAIPRRAVLRRPFARALLLPVLALGLLAALVAAPLRTDSAAGLDDLAVFVLAAVGSGLLLGVAWLGGQLLGTAARRLLASALAAAAAATLLSPVAIGPGGAYPGTGTDPGLWAGVLLISGILAVGAALPLLDRLRGAVLREQALRWESAGLVASSMDLGGTVGAFRLPPSAGRRLRVIGPGPLPLLYARRDAIAWLRSPERSATGVLAAAAATVAIGGSTLLDGPLSWVVMLTGTLILWLASGTVVDGLRHGVQAIGAPRLFGQSVGHQLLLHAIAPLLLLALLAALGGTPAALLAQAGADGVLLPLALVPVLVAGRARDAAKGHVPLALSTPMPTAQGDMSVLLMLGWQADALLIALLAGALLLAVAPLGAVWLLAAAAVLVALLTMTTRGRLRALQA